MTSDAAQTSLTKFKALEDTLNVTNDFLRDVQRYNTGVASEELDNLTENKENQNEIPTLKDDYTRHYRRH